MTRPWRMLALSLALAYGGLTTTSAFAQFEGLDLGSKKKKKGGAATATKGKKGKKGKKEEEEQGNLPPTPPETPATTSPAGTAAKPPEGGKPAESGGLGLDLTGSGDTGAAAKPPPKKGDKAAPTMSFEAVDVSGKTADRQKLDA